MSLGLGQEYYQTRRKNTITILYICMCAVGKITVSQCRHAVLIIQLLITVLSFFCHKWSNLTSRHLFSDQSEIFAPENFGICSKNTTVYHYHYHCVMAKRPPFSMRSHIHTKIQTLSVGLIYILWLCFCFINLLWAAKLTHTQTF